VVEVRVKDNIFNMGMDWLPFVGLKEVKDKRIVFKLLAEMIGTMVLVFFSCGSAESDKGMVGGAPNIVRYSLTFGFTVATMAQCIGHVSGCHINPAVTLGLFVGRKIGLVASILYIIFQCIGALIGAALLLAIQPLNEAQKTIPGITAFNPSLTSPGQAFLVEFVITFVLLLTVYAAAADDGNEVKGSPPLAIGLAIGIAHLFAGPITGPSMNPARSFGPAVVGGGPGLEQLWVYWLGPICGGVTGAITYLLAFQAKTFKEDYSLTNEIGMK